MSTIKILSRAATSLGPLAVTLLCACSAEHGGEPVDVAPAEMREPIQNGTTTSDTFNPGAVALYHQVYLNSRWDWWVRPCSGTLIRKQWVLTARHCVTVDGEMRTSLIPASRSSVIRTSNPGLLPPSGTTVPTAIIDHPSLDLALLRIAPHSSVPMSLWNGNTSQLVGATVTALGFGRFEDVLASDVEDGSTGAGQLRRATMRIDFVGTNTFTMLQNTSDQLIVHGDSGGPSFSTADLLNRSLATLAGVHSTYVPDYAATDVSVASARAWIKRKMFNLGDHNADGRSDIALTGGSGWRSIPVARGSGGGNFSVVNLIAAGDFPTWAQVTNAKPVTGDFNGDGRSDIALVGPSAWSTIPLALSQGSGNFTTTNSSVSNFPGWAATAGAVPLSGDFDGDGRSDIALTGVSGWATIPIAFSQGNGTFTTTNYSIMNFGTWAARSGAKILSGDFDGDGRDDLALTGANFTSIPIAFSYGNGTFLVQGGATLANFPAWSQVAGVKAVVGDFNADGRDDIALTGSAGWTSIPIAFSNGNGTFNVTNQTVSNFPGYAATANAKPVTGDFDGDFRDDIALTGPSGWTTIPVATSKGDGTFTVTNRSVGEFPALAAASGAKPVGAH